MDKGPLSKHRFQVWNKNQHPYKHTLSEFAYSNETMPGVNNPAEAMDWLIAVLYPLSQTAVATPADLPPGGNTLVVDPVLDTFTAAAHGYKDTDMVRIASTGTMPAPLMAGVTYFVIQGSLNDFKLALTSDPSATPIDITTAGTGTVTVENVPASYRVVTDDGDGKAAAYRWQQLPSDVAPQWYKVYDMDWSQDSILAAMMDVTQDLYVYQKGKQDLDENGDPLTGVNAGQNVYGSSQDNEHLTLYSNFIDPDNGFIQFGSQVAPKIHNVINLGESARRFVNLYLQTAAIVGNTVYGDGNIDAAGGVVDFNDNDITTTGDVTGDKATFNTAEIGQLNFATNNITSDTNIIRMLNQTLQDLINVISEQVTVTDGTRTLTLTVSALASIYNSSTGLHSFSNQDVSGIDELTANDLNGTTAQIANFAFAGNTITNPVASTITTPGLTLIGDFSANNITTGNLTANSAQIGNYSLDNTNIQSINANTNINLLPNGTGQNVFHKIARAVTDATLSLGTSAIRWTTLFLSGGLSDGTDSISIAQLLSFRNANTGANSGDVLFYDSVTQRWLPSAPDAEIDHGTLTGLSDDDHLQYLLLAGRVGGQTAFGGTVAAQNLTLQGNSADASNGDVVSNSNLRPSANNTRDLGSAAQKWKDIYNQGQLIGARFENTTAANNYTVGTKGRQYFNSTDNQPYFDVETFAKYAMHTDTVTNSTLTGAAQTVPFTLTNIVKLTNVSLTSISNIAIQADIQGNRYKLLLNDTGNAIVLTNGANIITGTGADFNMPNATAALLFYDGAAWRLVSGSGSGSGTGGIEYITNGNGEGGTTGWSSYNDGASARPVDGTGGVVTGVTFAVTQTNPLRGLNSFLLTKDAANRQGMGVSYDFTIDRADQGKVLTITKEYIVNSGTFVAGTPTTDGDVIAYIYNVTDGVLIEPSNIKMLSNSSTIPAKYQAEFQTSTTSRVYRLITHIASTSTSAYAVKFEASVQPNKYVYGSPVSDWVSWTPTGTWTTNTTYTGRKRRVGDQMEYDVTVALAGAPNVVSLDINLQETIDTTKLSAITAGRYEFGLVTCVDTGVQSYHGVMAHLTATSVRPQIYQTNGTFATVNSVIQNTPMVFGAGDTISMRFAVPIVGLSSSVQMSDNADNRVVAFIATKTATQAVTANVTDVTFPNVTNDTHGAFNGTTFVAPTSGYYQVSGFGAIATATKVNFNAYVGGVLTLPLGTNNSNGGDNATFAGLVFLNQGQTLTIRCDASITVTNSNLQVHKAIGSSTIAASETVSASYWLSANFAASTTIPINFDSKEFDSHNAVTTSATAWKFTAPTSGVYAIESTAEVPLTAVNYFIYKNGTRYKYHSNHQSGHASQAATKIKLLQGEFIDLRPDAAFTVVGGALNTSSASHISISKVGMF